MKRIMVLLLLLVLGFGTAAAQSNDVLDALLASEQADFASVAYLVRIAGGDVEEDVSVQEAYNGLDFSQMRIDRKAADAPVTLGELAYLSMETLGLEGGVMYRLLPSPRYAAREFAYLGFVPGKSYPNRILSGREAVDIVGRAVRFADRRSEEAAQ
jgi:hypothetical protein